MPCSKYKGKQRRLCYLTKEWTDWTKVKKYKKRNGIIVKTHRRRLRKRLRI